MVQVTAYHWYTLEYSRIFNKRQTLHNTLIIWITSYWRDALYYRSISLWVHQLVLTATRDIQATVITYCQTGKQRKEFAIS